MSLVHAARRRGRICIIIGLDREDVDHIISGDVVSLEGKGWPLLDFAIFGGETIEDLEENLKAMLGGKDD